MNVGYFSVDHADHDEFVDWSRLSAQKVLEQGKYFRHVRFESHLVIRMDGRKRIAVVECTEECN